MPLICNSIPKSGTYLLASIAECFGYEDSLTRYVDHGTTTARANNQFASFKDETNPERFNDLKENQYSPCHLTYTRELAAVFDKKGIPNIFIYRHPADIIYSYVRFVTYSPSFAGHSRSTQNTQKQFQENFIDDEQRFLHVFESEKSNFNFNQNVGWLNEDCCLSVKFEDLFSDVELLAENTMGGSVSRIFEYLKFDQQLKPVEMYQKIFGVGPTFSPLKAKIGQYKSLDQDKIRYVLEHEQYLNWLDIYGY